MVLTFKIHINKYINKLRDYAFENTKSYFVKNTRKVFVSRAQFA